MLTWIISHESNGHPSTFSAPDGVPHWGVHEVEPGSVPPSIKVSKPHPDHCKLVAMEMHWMVFSSYNARVLQHDLYMGSELQLVQLSSTHRLPQPSAHISRVVKLDWRDRREIGREDSRHVLIVCLHQGIGSRQHEGDIVHAGSKSSPVGSLAPGARPGAVDESKPNSEEEVLINL